MSRCLWCFASALFLACGGQSDAPAPEAPAAAVPVADTAVPPMSPSAGDSVTEEASGVLLALDGSGVMLVDAETGSSRAIAFGTLAGPAVEAVSRVLGPPTERLVNADCGMGPLEFVTFDGLSLALQDDHFLGWTARPGGTRVHRTMSNIGLGSTRAELEGAYVAVVSPTTLGTEFIAGGLQGVLASDAPTATIAAFWAGASCVAR